MGVTDTKGFPSYMKVIDASVQDLDPKLDFTDSHTRISEHAGRNYSVTAEDYVAVAQTKVENEKKQLVDENLTLKEQLAAMNARLAALENNSKPAEPTEPVKPEDPPVTIVPVTDPDKKSKSSK